jgi:hypothetical protein
MPEYNGAEVPYSVLLKAADKLGYDTIEANHGISLYGTIVRLARQDGIYVILVPHHVVTIEVLNKTAYFCDNQTKEPIPASSSARLGQKVFAAHRFVERPKPVFVRNTYRVDLMEETHTARFFKTAEYERVEDNRRTLIGSVTYDHIDELYKIVEAMQDVFTRK